MTNGCSSKPIKTSGKQRISRLRIKDWNLDRGSWLFKNVLLFFFLLPRWPTPWVILLLSCGHISCLCFSIFCLFAVEQCQHLNFTRAPNQPITARQQRCLVILITSQSHLCASVYMTLYVCVCVYRVFPHLASELCFSSGPFPCSVNFPPPPSLFFQTLLLLKPPLPVRARQKVGFQRIGARELASESCCVSVFLWGPVLVCRLIWILETKLS